ncbi:MAG: class I SAM-dependent methyltransferase [Candidatus Levybacteria bacterium]|nr:class I SAM-dependent methyltransferase [Candidatus Levybacteria bacterium]
MAETRERPTQKELYEKANELVKAGRKLDAVSLFEKAGYVYSALKLCEEEGDTQRAYEIAMRINDHYSADRIATQYHIAGHEYFNFPPALGRDLNEVMAETLESRLRAGATAENLGFHGFQDKIVADVGTRDGRFIPLFRKLGAKEVYGIDPDKEELEKAIQAGLLDRDHAIPKLLRDIPEPLKGTIEVATIFNFNMPTSERAGFFSSLSDALAPNGEVVMAIAEREIAGAIMPVARRYFNLRLTRLWDGNEDSFHTYLAIGIKKRE